MHDLIFENQKELSVAKCESYATELGLDLERFKRDVASSEVNTRVQTDKKEAEKLQSTGTPGFFDQELKSAGRA